MESSPAEPAVHSLRATLLNKLAGSRDAWTPSVKRFRALYWLCLAGVVVIPTCLASLKDYIHPLPFALLSVLVSIFGSVQAVVKPSDKFHRDIEFRDEADYFHRLALSTTDETQIRKIMDDFEQVERRFHLGDHPWPTPKRDGKDDSQNSLRFM